MFRLSLRTRARLAAASLAAALAPHLAAASPLLGRLAIVVALACSATGTAAAQRRVEVDAMPEHRSGPRFGITYLGGSIADSASRLFGQRVSPVVTQFGWQYEKQFVPFEGGPEVVNEWILLAGGLEQGVFMPSISWIVGLRLPNDVEFGVGPNISGAGTALVLTAGRTYRVGAMNVPVNVALVPSRLGTRVSFMTGFNLHD